jgi:tetratricopeptide (TPR) repeat protein
MRARIPLFGLCGLCWILSAASKEIALTLPVLIVAYEWFFFQNLDLAWLRKSAVFLVAGFGALLMGVCLVYDYSPFTFVTSISQPRQYTALERLLTQGRVMFIYISLLFYPHPARLNLAHDISVSHSLFNPFTTLLSFAGLFALLGLTILVAKPYRVIAFCIIWFFANLVIEALAASIEPMFEHRVYLPSMFFFVPFVWLLFRGLNKPKVVFSIMSTLIIIFGYWTFERNRLWNDPVAFWEDAAKKSPNHFRSHANLGVSYLDAKQYDAALEAFKKALTLTPPYPTEIYSNIGVLYLGRGQQDLARQNLNRALSLNSNNYVARDLLGTLDRKQGNYDQALKHYQAAININPIFAPSYHNLGILYMDMGELDNAVSVFKQAIVLRPKFAEAYSSLGLAWAKQAHYTLAISALRKAVQIDVQNEEALFNLANAYNLTGQYEMAVQTYKTLLKINPNDVEAMHNLGILYLKHLKNVQQAAFYLRKALATGPDYDQAAAVKDILSQMAVKP